MFRKILWVLLASMLASALMVVGCSRDETPTEPTDQVAIEEPGDTSGEIGDRLLTQQQRNEAIASRALQDLNRNVGLNCKEWARKVVKEASGNVVLLPQTLPNASGWYWADSPYVVGMSGGIRGVQRGWVVQTNWRLSNGTITPHTFIVLSRTSSGVNIIESNWAAPLTVKQRYVSFATFEAQVPLYSSHYIIGF